MCVVEALWFYAQSELNAHTHELGRQVSKHIRNGHQLNALGSVTRPAFKRSFVGERGHNLCTDGRDQ